MIARTTPTDGDLIRAYRTGDRTAFDALVRRHLVLVYRTIARSVSDPRDAEELAQEVFVRAWRSIARFDIARSFRAWILHIARNATIDHLRHVQRVPRTTSIEEVVDVEDVAAPVHARLATLLDRLVRADDGHVITVALERLSDHDRLILTLRYSQELTFREIAATLDAPLDTVKSRHRRALLTLRRLLVELPDGVSIRTP